MLTHFEIMQHIYVHASVCSHVGSDLYTWDAAYLHASYVHLEISDSDTQQILKHSVLDSGQRRFYFKGGV